MAGGPGISGIYRYGCVFDHGASLFRRLDPTHQHTDVHRAWSGPLWRGTVPNGGDDPAMAALPVLRYPLRSGMRLHLSQHDGLRGPAVSGPVRAGLRSWHSGLWLRGDPLGADLCRAHEHLFPCVGVPHLGGPVSGGYTGSLPAPGGTPGGAAGGIVPQQ